jgi:hypothetical protein
VNALCCELWKFFASVFWGGGGFSFSLADPAG